MKAAKKPIRGFLNPLVLVLVSLFSHVQASENPASQAKSFWTEKSSPQAIGQRLIEDLLAREDYMMYITDDFKGIHYAEAAVGYGASKLMHQSGNTAVQQKLKKRYKTVPGTDKLAEANHVDANVWGIVPLQLAMVSDSDDKAGKKQLKEGLKLADAQWKNPRADGLSSQSRFWIDDVWMVNSLQLQAYRASKKTRYLDRAALQTAAYLKRMQEKNGLFFHGKNGPFHWGRGNGWVASGLAELLQDLPSDHPHYGSVLQGYKAMMTALLKYQADDGMWRQLIDKPGSWKESSATAMFGFAMATGVQKGILPKERFQQAYEKAWLALSKRVNKAGKLEDICVGTGQSLDINYYLDRPKTAGDFHGQAPLLWFASVLLNDL